MTAQDIVSCNTYLGIELGSTRIKAVLLDSTAKPAASGSFTWENRFENGYWTYPLSEVWHGLRECFAALKKDVREKYGVGLCRVGAMGVSAMMHGYLPLDENGELLVPFRTWRNTTTEEAAKLLTQEFGFNIPQRWSIAHLYGAILKKEEHIGKIARLNTLAGYVHEKLTGRFVLGIGDASGMFPIDTDTGSYDKKMSKKYDTLTGEFPQKIMKLLPEVLMAGENAGELTSEGALLLDPSGELLAGIPFCPPEGDMQTGMVATNSVAERTGNVSAGTSINTTVVLTDPLSRVYPEIDIVCTPAGKPAALVHCNNCTNEINAWASLFGEVLELYGVKADAGELFEKLYTKSLEGKEDCDGITCCNYLSGETLTNFGEGCPLALRTPDCSFSLANFMRSQLYSAIATMALGMKYLEQENVRVDMLTAHGGFFKTPGVGQKYLAAATGARISVMQTAGEGGPYGMALLAAYMKKGGGRTLEEYLQKEIFDGADISICRPDDGDARGFAKFLRRYERLLTVERAAVDSLK